jgi:hypothetical protein
MPIPQPIARRAIKLLQQYLSTAHRGPGPQKKKGIPEIWTVDNRARKLLIELEELERSTSD